MDSSEDVNKWDEDDFRNNNFNVDSRDFETQQIDTQCLDTMPVDDSYLLEDAVETQYLNLGGETQVVDLVNETQVLDDLGCMKNMPAEFLQEFNTEVFNSCEDANKTEAFYETQVLSQDASEKIDDMDSVGPENVFDTPRQELFSGGFTSIRAASIRASGLAASEHGAKHNSYPTSSDKSSVEQETCKKDNSSIAECSLESGMKTDHKGLQNECMEDTEKLRNSDKCKVPSATVRKLFKDDEFAGVDQSDADDINRMDDNLDIYSENNCLAGLSYADSQEPGELSQAHALEVVDKFLDLHVMDLDGGAGSVVKNATKKTKIASGRKGSREMAKKSSVLRKVDGECGVYDWDDNREDDGGGEFFLKKKELFFDNGGGKKKCLTKLRNPNGDEKEQNFTMSKLKDSAYLDPGLMLHRTVAKGKQSFNCGEKNVTQKDFMKDIDNEQLNVDNEKNENGIEMNDVGPDTQIAAEAMETLCFEVLADDNGTNNDPDTEKLSRKNQSSYIITAHPEECLMGKRSHRGSVGVVSRQAKKINRTVVSTSNEPSFLPKAVDLTVLSNRGMKSTSQKSKKQHQLEDHLDFSVPVAHRTRNCAELARSKASAKTFVTRNELNRMVCVARKRAATKDKNATVSIENGKNSQPKRSSASNIDATNNLPEISRKKNLALDQAENLALDQADAQCNNWKSKRFRKDGTYSSLGTGSAKILSDENVENIGSMHDAAQTVIDQAKARSSDKNYKKTDAEKLLNAAKADDKFEASPPTAVCRIPANNVSPICMGDEYHTQSCRKNRARLSLITEMNKSVTASPGPCSRMKESRKRKDVTNVRVLFSQHLDEDIIKQQKKIMARLGVAVATLMSDASHFVADEFVRTRNMLEAIASGKPVVTHLWLESCGQARCLIDEKNYILRDSRKEREFGFCLPTSLSRACQHPLLQGQKVLVTPNTKPGKDILTNLVRAVHGLAINRVGRSMLRDPKLPDDLLIISCEEDYDVCVPFLEKGTAVYSSELLLNGIVKQKLEYERHRLFNDLVKRTRSTIRMKNKNGDLSVTKYK